MMIRSIATAEDIAPFRVISVPLTFYYLKGSFP